MADKYDVTEEIGKSSFLASLEGSKSLLGDKPSIAPAPSPSPAISMGFK